MRIPEVAEARSIPRQRRHRGLGDVRGEGGEAVDLEEAEVTVELSLEERNVAHRFDGDPGEAPDGRREDRLRRRDVGAGEYTLGEIDHVDRTALLGRHDDAGARIGRGAGGAFAGIDIRCSRREA